MTDYTVLIGDATERLRELPAESVHTCVTSPPYFGLRDYGHAGQIGLEDTPEAYIERLVEVFREVRRVLRDDGTLWLNLGDSYSARFSGVHGYCDGRRDRAQRRGPGVCPELPEKNLLGIPWRVAMALQRDGMADPAAVATLERVMTELREAYAGQPLPDRVAQTLERLHEEWTQARGEAWYLRQDIIWRKKTPMPESVRDRCTKAHEYLFLLSKSSRYYFDAEAIAEPTVSMGRGSGNKARKARPSSEVLQRGAQAGSVPWEDAGTRNRRSVWTINTKPFQGAHFAVFPPELPELCILAGSPRGGTVLDPFGGSGTTAGVALRHGREAVICEVSPEYAPLIETRVQELSAGFQQSLDLTG